MQFEPTEMQAALLGALDKLLAQAPAAPMDGRRTGFDAGVDAALEASGLLDAAAIEEFGPVSAALLVERVCRLPSAVEVASSALLRPLFLPGWPRPIAVLDGAPGRPARFLPQARTALFLDSNVITAARLGDGEVDPCPEFFAYPMGRLTNPDLILERAEPVGDPAAFRRVHQVATACELAGALAGALDAVLDHVRSRRQFGRPIGSFQAVQHRLAAAASRVAAGRILALRAAASERPEDPALALGYLQDCAPAIVYDLHQFMGAMGLTLEHTLYRWSYRAKLLIAEMGGASRQFAETAAAVWDRAH